MWMGLGEICEKTSLPYLSSTSGPSSVSHRLFVFLASESDSLVAMPMLLRHMLSGHGTYEVMCARERDCKKKRDGERVF